MLRKTVLVSLKTVNSLRPPVNRAQFFVQKDFTNCRPNQIFFYRYFPEQLSASECFLGTCMTKEQLF